MLQTFDSIISVMFVFLMFSLVVTAAREVVSAWLHLRSKTLKAGLDVLLGNLGEHRLKEAFWSHPFIKAVQPSSDTPSYIPSANIAAALLHLAAGNKPGEAVNVAALKAGLTELKHGGLATIVATVVEQSGAGATLLQLQTSLEKWVDGSMERISSLYQRKTRTWLFLMALLAAGAMNVDAIAIWQRIQSDKPLRDSLVAEAAKIPSTADGTNKGTAAIVKAAAAQANLTALNELGVPIGWTDEAKALYTSIPASMLHLFGIVASAFAASLGAPFWFDLLQRFMNVRSVIKPPGKPAPVSGK